MVALVDLLFVRGVDMSERKLEKFIETKELIDELLRYNEDELVAGIEQNPQAPIIVVRGGVIENTIGLEEYILVDWDVIKGC